MTLDVRAEYEKKMPNEFLKEYRRKKELYRLNNPYLCERELHDLIKEDDFKCMIADKLDRIIGLLEGKEADDA